MTTPRPDYDVLIVGAGIAGTALACGLQNLDLRVGLIEARPIEPLLPLDAGGVAGFDNRVSALTPESVAQLRNLGAWQLLQRDRCCAYRHMSVWDAQSTGSIAFDAAELGAECLGTIVENRRITAALVERMTNCAAVDLFCPARLEALERSAAGHVCLQLENGQQLSARLAVGADGALSRLRSMAGFRTREWDYGHQAIVCTVETSEPHAATAYQCFLPTGPLAFLPLRAPAGGNFCSIVWSLETDRAGDIEALPDADFVLALEEAFESRLGQVLSASPRVAFPLRQRHAVDYIAPGIALVGDAAHTIHPLAGQGINLGLRDVAVLAQELAGALQRGADPGSLEVLRRYQRRRKGDNLLMMAAMDGFKRLFSQQELPVRWLRSTGMRLLGSGGPIKKQIMRHAMGVR